MAQGFLDLGLVLRFLGKESETSLYQFCRVARQNQCSLQKFLRIPGLRWRSSLNFCFRPRLKVDTGGLWGAVVSKPGMVALGGFDSDFRGRFITAWQSSNAWPSRSLSAHTTFQSPREARFSGSGPASVHCFSMRCFSLGWILCFWPLRCDALTLACSGLETRSPSLQFRAAGFGTMFPGLGRTVTLKIIRILDSEKTAVGSPGQTAGPRAKPCLCSGSEFRVLADGRLGLRDCARAWRHHICAMLDFWCAGHRG